MKYCSNCAAELVQKIPPGDNMPRYVCESCGAIHYQNPNIIAGCLPVWEDKILLCKRAIEPRYGLWTMPAGFMENGETTEEAALRETFEEAKANVELTGLYLVQSIPQINQVYLIFRGDLKDLDFGPGEESLEVELFKEEEIPWDALAFPIVNKTLEYFFEDRTHSQFGIHVGDIIRPPR
ncbi:MAG: NUDIX hydrolase [Pseudomonadota bacterium]